MAFAGVVGAIGGHGTDLLICRGLVEQIRQNGDITNVAAGDLEGPHLQRFLVDPDVYLAPDAPLGAAVLAGVPLALTLGLDAGAVDQQVQRPVTAAIRGCSHSASAGVGTGC